MLGGYIYFPIIFFDYILNYIIKYITTTIILKISGSKKSCTKYNQKITKTISKFKVMQTLLEMVKKLIFYHIGLNYSCTVSKWLFLLK
jgi:hypothetical protein